MGSSQYPTLTDAFLMGVLDHTKPARPLIGTSLLPFEDCFSEYAEWDIKYGGTRLASFVAKDAPANVHKPKQYKKMISKLCYAREKMPIPESVLTLLRDPGVAVNDPANRNKASMANEKIASMVQDLSRALDLLVEWSIFQALMGSLQWNKHGVILDIDYGIKPSHFVTPSVPWDNHSNADVMGNFDTIQLLAIDDGAPPITKAIMSTNTFNHMKHNSAIRELMKYERGVSIVESTFLTRVSEIEIVKYDVTYDDDSGVTQKILPDGKVIFLADRGSTGAPIGHTLQGPAKANNYVPGRFSKTWDAMDPDVTWLLTGHYFVPALEYPDWVFVMDAYTP